MAGLTLGGGFGRIGPKFGLTIDNLIGAEVITADGRFVRANEHENPDLFWGLRGGGGNFGVVTSFEYRLHSVGPTLFGGNLVYPLDGGRQLMHSFADLITTAPDDLCVQVIVGRNLHGTPHITFDVCYCGPPSEAERVVGPLRRLGKPMKDELATASYVKLQSAADPVEPNPYGTYLKGGLIRTLTPALIDTAFDYLEAAPLTGSLITFQPAGGAANRLAPQATAYWNRHSSDDMVIAALWKVPGDGAARAAEGTRSAWAKLEPFTEGFYANLAESQQEAHAHRVQAAYGDNYPRLVALKKRYDPANLFRLNANIKPA